MNRERIVFLTGPLPPPPPRLTCINTRERPLELNRVPPPVLAESSSGPSFLSDSAPQSFGWPCLEKIVDSTPTTDAISNQQPQQQVCYVQCASSSSPYSALYDQAYVPQAPSVPSDSGLSPYEYHYYSEPEPIFYEPFEESSCLKTVQEDEASAIAQLTEYLYSENETGFDHLLSEPVPADCTFPYEDFDMDLVQEFLGEPLTLPGDNSYATDVAYNHQYPDVNESEACSSSSSSCSASNSPPLAPPTQQFVAIAPRPTQVPMTAFVSAPTPAPSTVSNAVPTRRKRERLVFSTPEEEYRIKRDRNNESSAKSRAKKRALQEEMKLESVRLEERNCELKFLVEDYERQIATLKDILYSKIRK